jgi:hypothetical protein
MAGIKARVMLIEDGFVEAAMVESTIQERKDDLYSEVEPRINKIVLTRRESGISILRWENRTSLGVANQSVH